MPDVVRDDAREIRADRGGTRARRSPSPQAEDLVLDYVTHVRQGPRDGAAVWQLDRHRPGLPRPRHAPPRRPPALPHDRRLLDQGAVPALVPAGLLRAAAPRAWPTGRWPTSGRASASWSTTGGRSSCRCPARTSRPPRRSPPSCLTRRAGRREPGRRVPVGCGYHWSGASPRRFVAARFAWWRSSAGRAPGCGPGGRGFESRRSPHTNRPGEGLVRGRDRPSGARRVSAGGVRRRRLVARTAGRCP